MIDSVNIIYCSENKKDHYSLEELMDLSIISKYKVSSFSNLPSNIKRNYLNLIILELENSDLQKPMLIKKIEKSEKNIKSILEISSEKVFNYIRTSLEENGLNNYLVNPFEYSQLEKMIQKIYTEYNASNKNLKNNKNPAEKIVGNEAKTKREIKPETSYQSKEKFESEKNIVIKKEAASKIEEDDLVENSPMMIFTIQGNKFTFFNKKAEEILKYSKDELTKIKPETLILDNDLNEFLNETKSKSNGKEIKLSTTLKTKDNNNIKAEGVAKYKKNSNIFLFYLSPIYSENKNTEESIRLAAAVKSLNSAVTITDTKKNIIYVNPAHKEMFGYEPSELIGKPSGLLYPSQDPYGVSEKIFEAVFLLGWEGERIAIRKNGEVFSVYEKTSAIKDKNGKEIGIVSVQDDITIRKRLEQALKESEEKFRTLIETASTPVIAVNDLGIINLYNPAAEQLFKYLNEEILDKNITTIISEAYRASFEEGFSKDSKLDIIEYLREVREIKGLKKNGDEFPMEVSISKCKIEGRLTFTLIIFDITERKDLEQQLLQSAKLAAVGELISGVTHEVNNPLAVVLGYSEMLIQEYKDNEELSKIIKIIYSESERARKVIHNLLSFARQHKPEKEVVKINEIIDNTISLTEYDLRKQKIEVEKNYAKTLPSILADPNQLQQVFLNLIINAQHAISDHKDSGKIIINTNTSNTSKHIEISIEDDGPGIPKKIIEKIFDPFFTTKPVGKGTGLGLSVSFGIINRHSGEIKVESEEGVGTKFFIKLPIDTTDINNENKQI